MANGFKVPEGALIKDWQRSIEARVAALEELVAAMSPKSVAKTVQETPDIAEASRRKPLAPGVATKR